MELICKEIPVPIASRAGRPNGSRYRHIVSSLVPGVALEVTPRGSSPTLRSIRRLLITASNQLQISIRTKLTETSVIVWLREPGK